jgi:hypothetical protein
MIIASVVEGKTAHFVSPGKTYAFTLLLSTPTVSTNKQPQQQQQQQQQQPRLLATVSVIL